MAEELANALEIKDLCRRYAAEVPLPHVPQADQDYVRSIIEEFYRFIYPTPSPVISSNATGPYYNISIKQCGKTIRMKAFNAKFLADDLQFPLAMIHDVAIQQNPEIVFMFEIERRNFKQATATPRPPAPRKRNPPRRGSGSRRRHY